MMFDVPYYKQIEKNDCGPTAVKMILEYLGEKKELSEIMKKVEPESSGATWTLALAKTCAEMGFKTEFYTTSLGFNPANYDLEFYKKETDGADKVKIKLEKLKIESIKYKVKMHEKSLTLLEIINKINQNCASIVLLNWNIIKGINEGFQGHFVPIVGYDEENIYVHNQGLNNPTQNLAIKKEVFEKARKSKGTDEDILFVYRK